MLVQYAYIKPRSQFGKQCIFEHLGPTSVENVQPDPECMRDYVHQTHTHRGVQRSTQFAVHEMQTETLAMKNTGVFHTEGGWPREINRRDDEAVHRFRRRVEREDNWVPKMKNLMERMEYYIYQNCAVNIYQNYFDDMIPTPLVLPYDVRTTNVYDDPQLNVRPVSHLSWSPGGANRLAASYSFMEFEVSPIDVNPHSYIWDIENPNKPLTTLRSISPLMAIEFNPRDPWVLVSGLMSGQVCNWDIRAGDKPVQVSHLLSSHRNPANQALWITSKTNTEFFSSSTSGTIKWWDTRSLRRPTDTLVMDLEEPGRADIVKAIGVSALQFEPTMGSIFMAGTQNGVVLNVNRKTASLGEKLGARFDCYTGPVVAIDRCPFSSKNFLTVGDWSAKIWAEDTREGSLVATCKAGTDLTGGCWSRSRYSVFFTINTEGLLEVYDILTGIRKPLTTFRVCSRGLTSITPHEEGQLLAVGSRKGSIYLLECSEGLTSNFRNDKSLLSAFLERSSRFEKAVDNRLKEMRLMLGPFHEELTRKRVSSVKGKEKKRESKEKAKPRDSDRGREKSEQARKKLRPKRSGKDAMPFADEPELAEAEAEYFRSIDEESSKFVELEGLREQRVTSLLQAMSGKKKSVDETKEKKQTTPRSRRTPRDKVKVRKPRLPRSTERFKEAKKEEEIGLEMDAETVKSGEGVKKRRRRILKKSCVSTVCKPEICCMDMEGQRKKRRSSGKSDVPPAVRVAPKRTAALFAKEKWYRKLSEYVEGVPERSRAQKRRILMARIAPPDLLREEVEKAKKEIRSWQERLSPARRHSRRTRERREDEKSVEKSVSIGQATSRGSLTDTETVRSVSEGRTTDTEKCEKKVSKSRRKTRTKSPPETEDSCTEVDKEKLMKDMELEIQKRVKHSIEVYPRISAARPSKYSKMVEDLVGK